MTLSLAVARRALTSRIWICVAISVALLGASAATFVSIGSGSSGATVSRSVSTSPDDARSPETGLYTATELSALIGSGNGQQPNIAGYRFRNVTIPPGSIIDSVTFTLVKDGTQQSRLVVDLAFEASANAASFSNSSPPARRARTSAFAHIDGTFSWAAGRAYALGSASQLAATLQQVVNQSTWKSGNNVALIAYGPAAPANARAAFYTFDSGASRAPKLTVTYHLPANAPTATSTRTASVTATRTATASVAATATHGVATATTAPTATRTPTVTPTATTPGSTAANHNLRVGNGYSDVSPHQLVRTSSNVLYVITPTCASYPSCPGNALIVYRANTAGTPTAFAAQDVAHQPTGVGSSASAIDGQNRIHTLWLSRNGQVSYAIFDTSSNTWGSVTALEATGWTSFGQGDEGVGLALDASGNPHAVWNVKGSDGRLRIHYATRSGAAWSAPVSVDDLALAPNHSAWHPTLAFGPDGVLWLAWLDGSFNYTPDGTIHMRMRSTTGAWGASVAIADSAMTTIDNGPSLLVTGDGVVHLTFLNTSDVIRYWYFSAGAWHGDRQPPTQVTHDPSLGPDGQGGVYIYGHGTPTGSIEGHGDNLYRFHRTASGAWGAWTLYATGAYDSSVSTRWAQFFQSFPQRLDILYWADPYPNVVFLGTE